MLPGKQGPESVPEEQSASRVDIEASCFKDFSRGNGTLTGKQPVMNCS